MHASVTCSCSACRDLRGHQISWNWSYRQLWATVMLLELNSDLLGKFWGRVSCLCRLGCELEASWLMSFWVFSHLDIGVLSYMCRPLCPALYMGSRGLNSVIRLSCKFSLALWSVFILSYLSCFHSENDTIFTDLTRWGKTLKPDSRDQLPCM